MTDVLILGVREDLLDRDRYDRLRAMTGDLQRAYFDHVELALQVTLGYDGEIYGDRSIAAALHISLSANASRDEVGANSISLARQVFDAC